jgi:hypothetical protein
VGVSLYGVGPRSIPGRNVLAKRAKKLQEGRQYDDF